MKKPKRVEKKELEALQKRFLVKTGRLLTRVEFLGLAEVPAEVEWFANIKNPRTRRAYKTDIGVFMRFAGIERPEDFRIVARSHVIAWRKDLEGRELGASTIRRKLSALSSLFQYLCEANAVALNPVMGVSRPGEGVNEGKTPALGDHEARQLLDSPSPETLKGKRDRAILSILLYHGLRADELCTLKVRDIQSRRGVPHLRVHGKGDKIRFVPLHPGSSELIEIYLDVAGHRESKNSFLFQPVKNNVTKKLSKRLNQTSVYRNIVHHYAKIAGVQIEGLCTHALRAATNALDNDADISKVQEWLGHSNISTTRLYDRRKTRPEESPTFKVSY